MWEFLHSCDMKSTFLLYVFFSSCPAKTTHKQRDFSYVFYFLISAPCLVVIEDPFECHEVTSWFFSLKLKCVECEGWGMAVAAGAARNNNNNSNSRRGSGLSCPGMHSTAKTRATERRLKNQSRMNRLLWRTLLYSDWCLTFLHASSDQPAPFAIFMGTQGEDVSQLKLMDDI